MPELSDVQRQMLKEYVKKDNERLEQEFEEGNVFYSLTLEAKSFLSVQWALMQKFSEGGADHE